MSSAKKRRTITGSRSLLPLSPAQVSSEYLNSNIVCVSVLLTDRNKKVRKPVLAHCGREVQPMCVKKTNESLTLVVIANY